MKYISVAAMMLALTACHSDEDLSAYSNDPNAVRINASIVGMTLLSRANSDATGAAWSNGDQLKVTNTTGIEGKQECAYTYALEGNTWTPQGSNYIVWASGDNTFEAFYPYTTATTNSFLAFTLPADQSALVGGLLAADWMTSTVTTAKTSDCSLDMTFKHELSKIKVQIVGYNNQYPTPADVTIAEPTFNIPTTQTPIANKSVIVAGAATAVKGYMATDTEHANHSFAAIVMPGEYAAGDALMSLRVNSELLTVSASSAIRLDAGKSYTFNLTVGKDKLEIVNVTVNPWTGATLSEGTADELPPYVGTAANIDTNNDVWIIIDPTLTAAEFKTIGTKLKAVAADDPARRIKLTINGTMAASGTDPAFEDCTALYSLDMPNIDKCSVNLCNGCTSLVSVRAPKVVSVYNEAFYGCTSLTSIYLPMVTYCGPYAFSSCSALTSISLPQASTFGEYAFSQCTQLQSVSLPNAEILSKYIFKRCETLSSIDIPKVTTLQEFVFGDCYKMTEFNLPLVTTVGKYAFSNCYGLQSVSLPNAETIGEGAFSDDCLLTTAYLPKVKEVVEDFFYSCEKLETVTLSEATAIGIHAFFRCYALKMLSLPKAKTVAETAFEDCTALESIEASEVTAAGNKAFYNCKALTSVSFPLLTEIGREAFLSCAELQSVSLPKLLIVKYGAFQLCPKLDTVDFPEATEFEYSAMYGCPITTVNLPKATRLGVYAFRDCTKLKSINIPKVTVVEGGALLNCSLLTSITLGEPITNWGGSIFSDASTQNITLTLSSTQKQMIAQTPDFYDRISYLAGEEVFTDWGKDKTFCGCTFKEIKQAN